MGDKIKWPLETATAIAAEICASLTPHCERIIVAGSIRRKKAEVGDIEIVYVPRKALGAFDLFEPTSVVDSWLETLLRNDYLAKRPNAQGRTAWGEKNKLALHCASGIPVDLFATTEAAWWNYVVCRTGGADNNVAIASAAKRRGWSWNPYGEGFSRPGAGIDLPPEIVPMHSEREVFEFVRLPYLEPEERR